MHGAGRYFDRVGSGCSTSWKRDSYPGNVGIGLLSRKIGVVPLPPTVLQLMMDVNVEDILVKKASGGGAELSSAERNAYDQWQLT